MKLNFESAAISDKLKALLAIASKVQQAGKPVTMRAVAGTRQQGASGKEIHDTVLISAAFGLHNRYVDGLATWTADDPNLYRANGKRPAEVRIFGADRSLICRAKKICVVSA
jgi:hypothetical protein